MSANRVLRTMNNAPVTWLPSEQPEYQEWQGFIERYRFVDMLFVSWSGCKLLAPEIAEGIAALRPLTEVDKVGEEPILTQLYSGDQAYRDLLRSPNDLTKEAAAARLRGTLVGADGETTCLVLGVSMRGAIQIDETLTKIRTVLQERLLIPPDQLVIVGPLVERDAIDRASRQAVDRFSLPSMALGIGICFCFLRSIPLTAVVLAVALTGQGWALALVELFGGQMNAVLIVLMPLLFVLVVSSGIHLSNYYLDALREEPHLDAAGIRIALKRGRIPCLLAALTTIAGLFSLWWVHLWPLQWFGTIGATVTAATMLTLWYLLPGAMELDQRWHRRLRKNRPASTGIEPSPLFMERLGTVVERHVFWVLFSFGMLIVLLVGGLFQLRTTVSVERMLHDKHSLKRDYRWFEENVAPVVNSELEIEFPHGTLDRFADRFELVRKVHLTLLLSDPTCGVLSAATFVPDPPTGRSVSANARRTVYRKRIENQFAPLQSAGFVARDSKSEFWRITLRHPFGSEVGGAERLASAKSLLMPVLEEAHPEVRLRMSGGIVLADVAQQALFDGLTMSFLSTFLLIGLSMWLMLRSIPASLLAMIPNLFPFLTLFGAIGFYREPLDIGIVMTASVALGIAVDDTIHFLTQYRAGLLEGHASRTAVYQALRHCGGAMFQTTAICSASMLIYGLSDFAPTRRFALLMCALLVAALVGDLVLLPALLWTRLGKLIAVPSHQAWEGTIRRHARARNQGGM
jgi:hypothetical protein